MPGPSSACRKSHSPGPGAFIPSSQLADTTSSSPLTGTGALWRPFSTDSPLQSIYRLSHRKNSRVPPSRTMHLPFSA